MRIYRDNIDKDLDISHVSDKELIEILDDMGRGLVYDYLLFGKDVTYEVFLDRLKLYLKIIDVWTEKDSE